jgi:hypothetical protein
VSTPSTRTPPCSPRSRCTCLGWPSASSATTPTSRPRLVDLRPVPGRHRRRAESPSGPAPTTCTSSWPRSPAPTSSTRTSRSAS